MENNKGRGIFYGVIGVATLVVAIIGATFAYFSATITLEGNVQAGTANIALTMLEESGGIKTALIPIDTDGETGDGDTVNNLAGFPSYVGTAGTDCLDSVGNQICSVYQFTLMNNSAAQQTITGYMNRNIDSTTETDLPNLYYAVFAGDSFTNGFEVHKSKGDNDKASALTCTPGADADESGATLGNCTGSAVIQTATLASTLPKGGAADTSYSSTSVWSPITDSEITLPKYSKVTFTVVVWLEETYQPQAEQGKTFAANIHFGSAGSTGVTGQISSTGRPAA